MLTVLKQLLLWEEAGLSSTLPLPHHANWAGLSSRSASPAAQSVEEKSSLAFCFYNTPPNLWAAPDLQMGAEEPTVDWHEREEGSTQERPIQIHSGFFDMKRSQSVWEITDRIQKTKRCCCDGANKSSFTVLIVAPRQQTRWLILAFLSTIKPLNPEGASKNLLQPWVDHSMGLKSWSGARTESTPTSLLVCLD